MDKIADQPSTKAAVTAVEPMDTDDAGSQGAAEDHSRTPLREADEYFRQQDLDVTHMSEECFIEHQARLQLKLHPSKHPANAAWAQAEYDELQRHCQTVRNSRGFAPPAEPDFLH
jgi:hypothetical protein